VGRAVLLLMQGFPQNHALLLTCRYAVGPLQGKMAVIPVRRMYKSVSAGLPAKSEGFASIMVHAATMPGACFMNDVSTGVSHVVTHELLT
jgi:hypothetical protein